MPPQAELHILARGQVWKQRVALENGADIALIGLPLVDYFAVQPHFAGGRMIESGNHPERRCLAATRRTYQ